MVWMVRIPSGQCSELTVLRQCWDRCRQAESKGLVRLRTVHWLLELVTFAVERPSDRLRKSKASGRLGYFLALCAALSTKITSVISGCRPEELIGTGSSFCAAPRAVAVPMRDVIDGAMCDRPAGRLRRRPVARTTSAGRARRRRQVMPHRLAPPAAPAARALGRRGRVWPSAEGGGRETDGSRCGLRPTVMLSARDILCAAGSD